MIDLIKKTDPRFVFCILPQHNAGLCDLGTPDNMAKSSSAIKSTKLPDETQSDDVMLFVPLVRAQLRGSCIMAAASLHRHGYPEHMKFDTFARKYGILVPADLRRSVSSQDSKQVLLSFSNCTWKLYIIHHHHHQRLTSVAPTSHKREM